MARLYDCFLYNNERELLGIRLALLAPVVDQFVVVWSRQTFTGRTKPDPFPHDLIASLGLTERAHVVELERLEGNDAWAKESFSRNAVARGLANAAPDDIVMVSDVDEIPRPSALAEARKRSANQLPVVFSQDYFNFKFNYKLAYGLHAAWAGPVLCQYRTFESAQRLREMRWALVEKPGSCCEDGGWHFSFITATDDVLDKLSAFSHQERAVQSRGEIRISTLIAAREGFRDHMNPGSIWVVAALSSLGCPELEQLLARYPQFLANDPPDDAVATERAIRHSVRRICYSEHEKLLPFFAWRELADELRRRLQAKIETAVRRN